MATFVPFICHKYASEKLEVFDGIFSEGEAQKIEFQGIWPELGR